MSKIMQRIIIIQQPLLMNLILNIRASVALGTRHSFWNENTLSNCFTNHDKIGI